MVTQGHQQCRRLTGTYPWLPVCLYVRLRRIRHGTYGAIPDLVPCRAAPYEAVCGMKAVTHDAVRVVPCSAVPDPV